VGLANDSAVIDSALAKVVETINAELPSGEQDKRAVLGQESVGGRVWKTLPKSCIATAFRLRAPSS